MANFIWKITQIKVKNYDNLQNVVVIVDWNYGDSQGISSIAGACELGTPEASKFIDYSSLTEAEVIGWIEQNLGATYIQNLQNKILENIELSKNLPISKPLPWVAQGEA